MEPMSGVFEGMFEQLQHTEGEVVPLKVKADTFKKVLKFCELCGFEPKRQDLNGEKQSQFYAR